MIISETSKCRKNFLCDYELSRDLPDALIEICVNCGKKVIYNKGKDSRIDNVKYLRDHIRQTVQPFGKTRELFMKIYGEEPMKVLLAGMRGKKSKEQIRA